MNQNHFEKNPFIAGNWVRGDNFFGREKLLQEILDGDQHYFWIAGTRRLGKTSLLKQLEYITESPPYRDRYISLFWDLQGSANEEGLRESLLESIEDAYDRFEDLGLNIEDLEEKSLIDILRSLKKAARQESLTVLLLCDECEELISVEKQNPELMPRLRRSFQQGGNLKTILCATKRLLALSLECQSETSPFLHGFIPPHYLGNLSREAAKRLLQRGGFPDSDIADILEKTNYHPYLIQLISKRRFENQDLEAVIQAVQHDDMVSHFFEVDFNYLEQNEKHILWQILNSESLTESHLADKTGIQSANFAASLQGLIQLGYLRRDEKDIHLANYFFEKWLQREKDRLFPKDEFRKTLSQSLQAGLDSGHASLLGETLSHYRIVEEIGRGAMGQVFKGIDQRLDRPVAIKILSPALLSEIEFRKRFFLEAKATSILNHTNIATIFEIDEFENLPYIVMELVEGTTLKVWRQSPLHTLQDQLNIAVQIAEGINCAHQNNIIHRDLKPDNIMVNHQGIVKVTDFGLAKMLNVTEIALTRTGATIGTPAYMSPEQVAGGSVDHRSDIYALGVVLYELFTDQLPIRADSEAAYLYAIIHQAPAAPGTVNPDLPKTLSAMLEKCLQKQAGERYDSLDAVIEELREVGGRV